MHEMTTIDNLRAEVAALRVVTQRLLGHVLIENTKSRKKLDAELSAASADLLEVSFTDMADQPSSAIEEQALKHLFHLYTCQISVGPRDVALSGSAS